MASKRHGLVTRTFDVIRYRYEAMDKSGTLVEGSGEKVGTMDDQALRAIVKHDLVEIEQLLISLEVVSRENNLFAQSPDDFVKNAFIIK